MIIREIKMKPYSSSERGFTLIELLTVIFITGVLSYLSLVSFEVYRSKAAYASIESTLHSAMIAAEASQTDQNNLPAAVSWYYQEAQGSIQDAAAGAYLSGLKIPRDTRIWASYDPSCVDMGCLADFVEVKHCKAKEYAFWARWGDGFSTIVGNLAGGGC